MLPRHTTYSATGNLTTHPGFAGQGPHRLTSSGTPSHLRYQFFGELGGGHLRTNCEGSVVDGVRDVFRAGSPREVLNPVVSRVTIEVPRIGIVGTRPDECF